MKKRIFILGLVIYFLQAHNIFSQSPIDTTLASKFVVDFAIPDDPAFQLISVQQSNILRPATVRDFAVAVSDFISPTGQISIPSNFGVEFSPGLLINGANLSLREYQQNAALYRLRLSAAYSKDQGDNSTRLALGVRTSIIDKSDLRTNTTYLTQLTSYTDQIAEAYTNVRLIVGPFGGDITSDSVLNLNAQTQSEKNKIDSLNNLIVELNNSVSNKDAYADSNWNQQFLDAALGTYGMTGDTSGNNFTIQNISFWLSYADGFKTTWLQLLLGLYAYNNLDSLLNKRLTGGSLAGRVYMGNNDYKFFVECQGTWKDKYVPVWLFNFGSEANIFNAVWFEFSGGLNFLSDNKPKLVTNFNIKLSLADLFVN